MPCPKNDCQKCASDGFRPEVSVAITVFYDDGIKKPASDTPYRTGARNEETAEILPGDQESVKKDDDGWIEWNGGACPVDRSAFVDVIFRDGEQWEMKIAHYLSWGWSLQDSGDNIVKYRPARSKVLQDVQEQQKPAGGAGGAGVAQPDKDGWIPHVPGEPMPCNKDTIVHVKLGDGTFRRGRATSWWWGATEPLSCSVIAWCPDEQEQLKPERKSYESLEAEISRLNTELHKAEKERDRTAKRLKAKSEELAVTQKDNRTLEVERDFLAEKLRRSVRMGYMPYEMPLHVVAQINELEEKAAILEEKLAVQTERANSWKMTAEAERDVHNKKNKEKIDLITRAEEMIRHLSGYNA